MSHTQYIESRGETEANELLCSLLGDRFRAYRTQWEQASNCEILTDFPLFLVIEQRYACNLRCIHCVHGYDELKSRSGYDGVMDDDLYRRVIDEAAGHGCPSLSLNNIDEPSLQRNLPERIRYAADHGILDIMINTNALLLIERVIERVLDSGLTRLLVSMDAVTRETYNRIRIGSNFDKVLANVDTFLNMRAKRNLKLPLLRVSMVRLSFNEHEVAAFVEFWRERADYIAIQEFASPEPEWERFQSFFAASRTVLDEFRCPQPWQRIIVQGDGTVLPCCSQFARELALGNVRTDTLHAIWRSERMDRLRELHKRGQYRGDATCAKCVSTWVGCG